MRHRPEASGMARVTRPFKLWHPVVLAFGTFLAMCLQPLCAVAQPVRERVSVGVIRISITAQTSSGKPVRDLALEDLSLRVDGQPVRIDSLTDSGRAASPREPGATQREQDHRPSGVTAGDATIPPAPEPVQLAVLIDEGGTHSLDRRDVYKQLDRYLHDAPSGQRMVMIARASGGKLDVLCPWSRDPKDAEAALKRLAAHAGAPKIVSPHEIPTLSTPDAMSIQTEIIFARDNLFRAVLLMLAAFPREPARRSLVVATGGIALLAPPDFAALMRQAVSETDSRRGRERLQDPGQDLEQARNAFQLWSNMPRRDWYAQLADVTSKAQEKGVAFVPLDAEALERGTNPGVESKWGARAMPGVTRDKMPGSSGMSARMPVGQTMTAMAIQTGGEAILVPLQAADRLSSLSAVEPYLATFRDPFPDDHRHHAVEILTTRRGVTLHYRRGYRTPTEEEEILDGLMVRLVGPAPAVNPLAAKVTIAASKAPDGKSLLHLTCQYEPPRQRALESEQERGAELLVAAEDEAGNKTDPAKWSGTARRVGPGASFALDFDLNLPLRNYRWSIAIRDGPTGLVSYVITESRP
jgi:VWFA-related protein